MATTVISANGDYVLPPNGTDVTQSESSTVMILENSATATLLFGMADLNDNFLEFPDGDTILIGDVINHGMGCKLMVRASGIISGSVTIRVLAH